VITSLPERRGRLALGEGSDHWDVRDGGERRPD
jgi:hypothetical protein